MGGRGGSSKSKGGGGGGGGSSYESLLDKYEAKFNPYGTITRKQAGVLFRLTKTGELKAGDDSMNWMYRFASDSRVPTTNAHAQNIASDLGLAVTAAMNRDYGGAATAFNHAVDNYYLHYSDSLYPKKSKVKLKMK